MRSGKNPKAEASSGTAGGIEKILPENWLPSRWKEFLPAGWLPETWKERERLVSEGGVCLKICHFNPVLKAHPTYSKPGTISSSADGKEITVAVGSEKRSSGGPKHLFEILDACLQAGYLPGWEGKIEDLRKQYTTLLGPEFEKFDFDTEIVISQLPDEKIAKLQFEDYLSPGKSLSLMTSEKPKSILGIPDGTSVMDLFKSDAWRSQVGSKLSDEQLEQLEKFYNEQLPELHLKAEKMRKEVEKERERTGVKGHKAKYLGCEAIYYAGGVHKNAKMYVAFLMNRYLITGRFLWAIGMLPPGGTPCDSLTKFETKTTTERIGNETFTTHEIIPLKRTCAQEDYLNKEECEEILKTVFQAVENLT